MTGYRVLIPMIILPLLVGCGGSEVATTGHAVGYIYTDAPDAAADTAAAKLYLMSAPTGDPTLKPLAGVTLILVEADKAKRTTSNGAYAFYDLEPGQYTLRALHKSYAPRQWEITVRAGYTTLGQNIIRRNVKVPRPRHRDSDRWWDDDDDDDDDDDSSGGGGGSVPQPPPTDDSTDDGGGISVFRVAQ